MNPMTDFQSAQKRIERHTLEFRILQLLIRYQIKRAENGDVIYIDTGVRFTPRVISEQLGCEEREAQSALVILMRQKPAALVYPEKSQEKSQWFVTHDGIQYFGESVRNIWHNTTQSVSAHRAEALMGAKEEKGRWVPTEMSNAALTSTKPPSSQDCDGAMIDTVEQVARIRTAAAQLRTTPENAADALAKGTARKCPKCEKLLWIESYRSDGHNGRHKTVCRACEKKMRSDG